MPRGGGRSSGGSRSSSASRPSPTRNTTQAQAPARQQPSPPAQQAQAKPSMFSGMGGMLMSGMAFGAGSEIAHSAIRSVTGGGSSHNQQVEQSQPQEQQQQQQQQQTQYCSQEATSFSQCLTKQSDLIMCQSYMDVLKECQKRYNV